MPVKEQCSSGQRFFKILQGQNLESFEILQSAKSDEVQNLTKFKIR